jgi:8-oxo-dGTP pyrophosphatase MutT (NUDIX family)
MGTRKYQAAGGVVIQKGMIPGQDQATAYVLLLDRPDRDEVRLPKGHIDPGEDAEATALRETEEEAGFADLAILADLGSSRVTFDYNGNHYIRDEHYFLMTLRSLRQGTRPANDIQQFRPLWVKLDEAPGRLTFAAEQQVVQKAVEQYRALMG